MFHPLILGHISTYIHKPSDLKHVICYITTACLHPDLNTAVCSIIYIQWYTVQRTYSNSTVQYSTAVLIPVLELNGLRMSASEKGLLSLGVRKGSPAPCPWTWVCPGVGGLQKSKDV